MKLYEVSAFDDEPSTTYATKREAIAAAKNATTDDVKVDEITVGPLTKDVIVRLINVAGGYVSDRRTVWPK